jgi:hypothetical protein
MDGSLARWKIVTVTGILWLTTVGLSADAAPGRSRLRGHGARGKQSARAAPSSERPSDLAGAQRLEVMPASITLDGPRAVQHLVVTAVMKDGSHRDVTDRARFIVGNTRVATVSEGIALPRADGQTRLTVKVGGLSSPVAVTVRNAGAPARVQFVNDVMPVLAKAGCNSTACHGSPAGKAGFKLSLFGYEPALDHEAIVQGSGGRRVNLKEPARSLILLKPTFSVSHGGGQRFKVNSPEYRTLLAWLKAGASGSSAGEPTVQRVTVTPDQPWLPAPGARQHLLVTATLSDGSARDVTDQALFSSNDDGIAAVDGDGVVTARRPGETAIMVRYLGQVAVSRVAVLPPWQLPHYPRLAQNNFIDTYIQAKLRKLRVVPSDLCTDEEFIRRATIDTCGIIPTVEEVRAFTADPSPDRRARLVDRLLERPEYVDLWTLKWNDALRNNPRFTREGLLPFSDWIREQVRSNRPFDQFVRDLLTASGKNADLQIDPDRLPRGLQQNQKPGRGVSLVDEINNAPFNPAANYFLVTRDPLDLTSATSQTFLGVRIECARCHNHPFEKWTQSDYYHLAAFFTGINARGNNQTPRVVSENPRASLRDPNTKEVVEPRTLDGVAPKLEPDTDRRAALAGWLTSPGNPFFAQATVNRIWAHYFGRGFVEPVDDFRVTNPPSNPDLLKALAAGFVDHRFDVRWLHRLILNSRTYQQSSRPNRYNRLDTSNFSRFYPRRLMAEAVYDSISQATGVFLPLGSPGGGPPGKQGLGAVGKTTEGQEPVTRVLQFAVPPRGRRGPAGNPQAFLDMFGRPRREVVCTCERSTDGSIGQALALINGGEVNTRIEAPEGRVQRLIREGKPDAPVIEELYLATLSRRPTAAEQKDAAALIHAAKSRDQGIQDLMWGLLNSREFLFVH